MSPWARRGSATVEFALVVPLFFMIVFGLVNFALVLAGFSGATYASEVGVRYAIVRGGDNFFVSHCTNTDITNYIAPYLWAAPSYSVSTKWTPDNNTGSVVTVSIKLTYKTGIPFSALSTITVGTSSSGTIMY